MVFRAQHAKTYKLRVVAPSGASATLSTGCQHKPDAADVERTVREWQGTSPKGRAAARPDLVERLVRKELTLRAAYDMEFEGTLDAWLDAQRRAESAPAPALDLVPYLDLWQRSKAKRTKGAGQAAVYRAQLATLFPVTAPFTLETFTRREIQRRIEALDVQPPTRNRYRAAASSFARYLVSEDVLESNVALAVVGFGENTERVVYYNMADAERLIAGLEQPYAGLAAFAAAFAMEWTALHGLLVGDLDVTADPITVRARGTKRDWRDRRVPLVPELRWLLPALTGALAGKLPTARVFEGVPEWRAIRIQRKVARALGLHAMGEEQFSEHGLHDWRHSHAVWLLKAGYQEQIVAAHLGHKNTDLVRNRYGVFKPDALDYARDRDRHAKRLKTLGAATNLATSTPRSAPRVTRKSR